jgi:hypothetical protein
MRARETLYLLALWAGLWAAAGLGAVLWVLGFRCAEDIEDERRAGHVVGDP